MSDLSLKTEELPSTSGDEGVARYRSAAVARMVRMPVATLRIWERRYRVSSPTTTPSGHRLYSALDIQRLVLLKQLTELGHAIGSIAHLDMAQLREVARTHASTMAAPRAAKPAAVPPLRCVVVGSALAQRLQRPSLLRLLQRPVQIVATAEEAAGLPLGLDGPADLVLVHLAGLHADSMQTVRQWALQHGVPQVGVTYSFAAEVVLSGLKAAGVACLREPVSEAALVAWLRELQPIEAGGELASATSAGTAPWRLGTELLAGEVPARRYDDATLADFAGLSSTIACECPKHVAELVMQLSRFEAYSAECSSRDPADAALHRYLQQVSGAARAMFEAALERVAIHEGLVLPR